MSNEETGPHMEPSTPVLDQTNAPDFSESTLAGSLVWLLSMTLPECYIQVILLSLLQCFFYINNVPNGFLLILFQKSNIRKVLVFLDIFKICPL